MSTIYDNHLNIQLIDSYYTRDIADNIFKEVLSWEFQELTLRIMRKKYTPKWKVIAFGDPNTCYSFSGTTLEAKPWTALMEKLKNDIEETTKQRYNYVLLNFYPDV